MITALALSTDSPLTGSFVGKNHEAIDRDAE